MFVRLGVGVFLVLIPLFFVALSPELARSMGLSLRVITALGGALIGSVIPGMLEVEVPYARAAGAIGVFLIIFAVNPPNFFGPATSEESGTPNPTPAGISIVSSATTEATARSFEETPNDTVTGPPGTKPPPATDEPSPTPEESPSAPEEPSLATEESTVEPTATPVPPTVIPTAEPTKEPTNMPTLTPIPTDRPTPTNNLLQSLKEDWITGTLTNTYSAADITLSDGPPTHGT